MDGLKYVPSANCLSGNISHVGVHGVGRGTADTDAHSGAVAKRSRYRFIVSAQRAVAYGVLARLPFPYWSPKVLFTAQQIS